MKLEKLFSSDEVDKLVPLDLVLALCASPDADIVYCHVCDGMRLQKHDCKEWTPGIKAQLESKGLKLQSDPFPK